ncbi:MAG: adenylate/guanylate cyclase domain-containing protein [Acidimicrobiia bacterium]
MSSDFPKVRYAEANDVHIAYEVRGDGPIDLVRIPGTLTSLVASFLDPVVGEHYDHLARFSRLIRFDKRGTGLSDPVVEGGAPLLEQQVEDVLAVMDEVGSQRTALYAGADGGPVAILFAAMYPERVSALVLNSAWARRFGSPGHPVQAPSAEDRDSFAKALREGWGDLDAPIFLETIAPSRRNEPGFAQLLARLQQVSASKATIASTWVVDVDVSAVLPHVKAETLVLCAAENAIEGVARSRFLAEQMPNARLVTYPGADTYFGVHTPEQGAIIEEFLTGARQVQTSDRVLTTVMFTDIVASTSHLAAIGDLKWRAQLDRHDAMVRGLLRRFRGREVRTTGDGFFATFDGPARAIGCAREIANAARELAIEVRSGIHVGECEKRGDDFGGIAVHIGARVCALAGPGEVLVTSTVRDLVAGSGITFVDRGCHELKGVPGEWPVLAAQS